MSRQRSLSKANSMPAIKILGGALRTPSAQDTIPAKPSKPRMLNLNLCELCTPTTTTANHATSLSTLLSHWPSFLSDLSSGRRLFAYLASHESTLHSPEHCGRESEAWSRYMDENQRMSIRGFLEMVLPHSRIVLQDIPYDNYKGCLRCTLLEFYGLYWQGAYLGRQYVRLDDQLVVCRAAGILGDGYVPGHLQDLKKDMRKMRACGLI